MSDVTKLALRKSRNEWLWSSSVELGAKFMLKSLKLSVEDDITFRPFIMEDTVVLFY